MNIKYEIHSIKNSNGKGEERHYAHLHEGTAMNADQLESHIEESCSLTTRVRDKDCIKNRVKRAKLVRFALC